MISQHTVVLTEEQRQLVLLAIAHMAIERPGWDMALAEIADVLEGRPTFDVYLCLEADSIRKRNETIARIAAQE